MFKHLLAGFGVLLFSVATQAQVLCTQENASQCPLTLTGSAPTPVACNSLAQTLTYTVTSIFPDDVPFAGILLQKIDTTTQQLTIVNGSCVTDGFVPGNGSCEIDILFEPNCDGDDFPQTVNQNLIVKLPNGFYQQDLIENIQIEVTEETVPCTLALTGPAPDVITPVQCDSDEQDLTYTVTNTSSDPITFTDILIESFDINDQQLTINNGSCVSNNFVPGNGSCEIDLVFTPTCDDDLPTELNRNLVVDPDGSSCDDLEKNIQIEVTEETCPLSLTGPVPSIITPVACNTANQPLTYTVTNASSSAISFDSIAIQAIDGFTNQQLTINNGSCVSDGVVLGNSSCEIDLVFNPSCAGTLPAAVNRNLVVDSAEASCLNLEGNIQATVTAASTSPIPLAYIAREQANVLVCPLLGDNVSLDLENCFDSGQTFFQTVDVVLNNAGTLAYVMDASTDSIFICPVNPGGTLDTCDSPSFNPPNAGDLFFSGLRLNANNTQLFMTDPFGSKVVACTLDGGTGRFTGVCSSLPGFTFASGRVAFGDADAAGYVASWTANTLSSCNGSFGSCTNFNIGGASGFLGAGINASKTHFYGGHGSSNQMLICPITATVIGDCTTSTGGGTFNFDNVNATLNLFMEYTTGGVEYAYVPNTGNNTISVCTLSSGLISSCTATANLGYEAVSIWIANVLPAPPSLETH